MLDRLPSSRAMRVGALAAVIAGMILILPGSAGAAVFAGNTGWFWGNPSPQGNSLTALSAATTRMYAAGDSGTVLRSDDGGADWSAVSSGLLDPIREVVAVSDDSFVFAGDCALRRSDDAGASIHRLPWTASDAACPSPIRQIAFPSLSTGYILLADGSVLATADGGYTWQPVASLPGTPAGGGAAAPAGIAFASRLVGVALVGGSILRTTDGGATWNTAYSGSTALRAVAFLNVNNGYVVGDDGVALRTADGGAGYQPIVTGAGVGQYSLTRVHCNAGTCIAVDPQRAVIALLSPAGSALRPAPFPGGANGDVAAAPGGGLVAVDGSGEVFTSADSGGSWTQLSRRIDAVFTGIHTTSQRLAVAYGKRGALALTTDGGHAWTSLALGTDAGVVDASFRSPENGFVVDDRGVVHWIENGADTWDGDRAKRLRPRAVYTLAGHRVLLVGRRGLRIWRTVNNRLTRANGVPGRARLTSLDSTGRVLVAYGMRVAYVSTKSARRWQRIRLPRTRSIASLDFIDRSTGYVLDRHGELWFTDSRGRHWHEVDTTGDTTYSSVAFSDDMHGYLASASGRILRTEDGGESWARQFPFFDSREATPLSLEATGKDSAVALERGTNRLIATDSGGQAGFGSRLTTERGASHSRDRRVVVVRGTVIPAKGGEVVTVLARAVGAKPGTRWVSQTVSAAADGSFSTRWRISRRTVFVARWSGDAQRESAGAFALVLAPKKQR